VKFTLNWLKEHLETDASLDEIVEGLMGIGLEVEDVHDPAKLLAPFTVAKVREARQHPDADRLRVCDVETAQGLVQVVCGAPNARTGMTGIFAAPGSHIPGINVDLEVGVIRGVKSAGMLLSERELMISDNHEGIIDLDGDFAVGTPGGRRAGPRRSRDPRQRDAQPAGRARRLRDRPRPRRQGLGRLAPLKVEKVAGGYDSPVSVRIADTARLPDVRRPAFPRASQRAVAGLDAGPPQGHRLAPHLGAGRHHQLRHVRLCPAAARLRRRQADRRHHRQAVAAGRDDRGARRPHL
jgi:phenylalanyl-tRNA synthetase beta chain